MTNVYERPEDAAKRFAERVIVLESRIRELEAELARLKQPAPAGKDLAAYSPGSFGNYYLCSRRHVPGEYCGECGMPACGR